MTYLFTIANSAVRHCEWIPTGRGDPMVYHGYGVMQSVFRAAERHMRTTYGSQPLLERNR